MDYEKARFNMVEQQIRPWEVLDPAVLELLITLKREDFVPPAYRAIAFTDMEIPIGHGQAMMAPKVEAKLLQEVGIQPGDTVLEVGTGSGYMTALLAKHAVHVTSIEYHADLSRDAAARLAAAGIANVKLIVGDAAVSPAPFLPPDRNKFDVIVLTGSVPVVPPAYLDALKDGGRLIAVVGAAPAMKATLFTKTANAQFASRELFETVLTPLINAAQPSRFSF